MIYAFDLDGTIFDTYAATKEAYEAAGLPEYKEEYWGKTAAEWGCPLYIHKIKKRIYPKYMRRVTGAWANDTYQTFQDTAIVLTGATGGTVRTLRELSGLPLRTPYGTGLSWGDKRAILKVLARSDNVFYFEDLVEVGKAIVAGTDITLITQETINDHHFSCR